MSSNKQRNNIPPSIEVARVVLEKVFAISPVQKVNLKDWEYEYADEPGNTSDGMLYVQQGLTCVFTQ